MNVIQNGESSNETPQETGPGTKETIEVPGPSFGFTESGTFRLEVDLRLGFFTILGTLTRAIAYVNGAINQQEAKLKELEKQKSLLKPKNGLGKFFGLAK